MDSLDFFLPADELWIHMSNKQNPKPNQSIATEKLPRMSVRSIVEGLMEKNKKKKEKDVLTASSIAMHFYPIMDAPEVL